MYISKNTTTALLFVMLLALPLPANRGGGLPDDYASEGGFSPRSYYWIRLPRYEGEAYTVKLIILSVYKGSKYDDTCISEVLLRKQLSKKPNINPGR